MDLPIYDNQREAALEICHHFENGSDYVILVAVMQGGKTGVGREVCITTKRKYPNCKIYLVCGMNYLNLKHQAIREFHGIIHPDDILFSKDLENFENRNGIVTPNFENSLFIIDESHFAQDAIGKNKKVSEEETIEGLPSLIHRFFTKNVGLTLDAQKNKWRVKNVKVLSISATPMSEIAHLDSPNEQCPKNIVVLNPGSNYYGFERMLEVGKIKQAFNLNKEEELGKLVDLLGRHNRFQITTRNYKYALLRFNNNKKGQKSQEKFFQLLETHGLSNQIDILKFYHKEMDIRDINSYIGVKPSKFTIVILYHSLRAGVQVITSNICMVHETRSAHTDVTAQGLPGRCCGYNKEEDHVDIYCNVKAIKKYIKWARNGFNPRLIPPKSKNIKISLEAERVPVFEPNQLIGIKLPDELVERIKVYSDNNPRRYGEIWNRFGAELRTVLSSQVTPDFWETYEYISSMILTYKNKNSSWEKWWVNSWNAFREGRAICAFRNTNLDEHGDNLFFVYINLRTARDENGNEVKDPNGSPIKDPNYGWILIPSKVRKDEDDLHTLTTKKEQYHPDNNPDLNIEIQQQDDIVTISISPNQSAEFHSASLVCGNQSQSLGKLMLSRLRNAFRNRSGPERPSINLQFKLLNRIDHVARSLRPTGTFTIRVNGQECRVNAA